MLEAYLRSDNDKSIHITGNANAIRVLYIVRVKVVPFQVGTTPSFHTDGDGHANTGGIITKHTQCATAEEFPGQEGYLHDSNLRLAIITL